MVQQAALFDSSHNHAMTISEVAGALSVSEASVRNWIKTGYLRDIGKSAICRESYETFCTNVAGKEKLTKRANKSLLDEHHHGELVAKTKAELSASGRAGKLEALAEAYQSGLSNAYRNKEGIYYTPEAICDAMLADVPKPTADQTFCDGYLCQGAGFKGGPSARILYK